MYERVINEVTTWVMFKASTWFCYVDDTFMIWNHGEKELNKLSSDKFE